MRLIATILLLAALVLPVSAQYSTTWERSAAGSGVPSWFSASANTERGFGYGVVGSNPRLYVVSRNGGTSVRIVNALTGSDVGTLDVTGVSGGVFPLNDAEVSDDGIIMACNMTTDAVASPFRCYTWTAEGATPSQVITYTAGASDRLGDKVTLTGSCATNTATLWAASGNSTTVYKFATSDNCASFAPTTVSVASSMGATADVQPDFSGSGGFFGTGSGSPLRAYSATGTVDASATVVGSATTALASFTSGGRNYVGVFDYVSSNATIVDVTDGLASATAYGATPSLGSNGNGNGTGDVAVRDNGDGTFTLFVMETNNGLGAYTTNAGPLPVELVAFAGVADGATARLTWTTASETNNAGFAVEQRIGDAFAPVGFVPGRGTTLEAAHYVFSVDNLAPGRHTFRLVQRDFDGSTAASDEVMVEIAADAPFALAAVRPHPVRDAATAGLYVATPQAVRVELFDVTGRLVQTLHTGLLPEGTATFTFDATTLPSGLYVLRDTGETASQTQLVTVAR